MKLQFLTADEVPRAAEEERVLLEQTPGHYPEFLKFLRREIGRYGGMLVFRAGSGTIYRVGLVPGEAGAPEAIEVCSRMDSAGQTIDTDRVHHDLWPFFEWMIGGVGGEWNVEDLRRTGAIYRIPGAP